ncbi:hypothetical protein WRSd3_01562 [Shigella dysenteriae WRSd3]|uniref:Uncharacterized protein n=2 Tax=Shigella dysenteriae TaxID=622 RepID=A0A090NIY4_SHIDY|nr:hypothetical protein Asd1617_02039 [Shigella dysenteriae 1617]ESU80275.1 hypothetical protein WRSd3_01562 [Shigella dysenteriae WRSd3]ESU83315.1 hypothetical protein WRSd5_01881 [Shigella dysenteriae WRSd5]
MHFKCIWFGYNSLISSYPPPFMHFYHWLARTLQSTFTAQALLIINM